jgi:acyl carrier protein
VEAPVREWPDTFDAILRTYCPYAAPDRDIEPDASLSAMGVDSMAMVNILVEIEDAFAVTIALDSLPAETIDNPTNLWRAVWSLVAADAPAPPSPPGVVDGRGAHKAY